MAGLEGKVALVTGAGGMRGVGRATVMKLAGLGADIALTDVHRETEDLPPAEVRTEWGGLDTVAGEVEAGGRRSYPVFCDLSDAGQIERMVDHVMDTTGASTSWSTTPAPSSEGTRRRLRSWSRTFGSISWPLTPPRLSC